MAATRSFLLVLSLAMPLLLQARPVDRELPKVLAVNAPRQYRDYYGTALTRNPRLLRGGAETFRWGVTNPKTLDMCCFGGTLLTDAAHAKRFRASLYADPKVKMPLVFTFRVGDRNGEVLETVSLAPGETRAVDIPMDGRRALFFSTDVKIGHDKVERLILGEPRFE
jgi:hypothetical protein